MHSALLIDEILRQVFYFSDSDRSSLLSSACTCKAWKDPALDFIWDRLSSFGPLLLLLPGVSLRNGEYVFGNRSSSDGLTVFKSYARRVKHINHRQAVKINPGISALSPFSYAWKAALPNLATAHITMPKCTTLLMPLSLSPNLRHLDIDLGFKAVSPFVDAAVCDYLGQANSSCQNLRQLSLRGLASKRLNSVISGMSRLDTISLRLGRSLVPETLQAIMTFPDLIELEIHAGHIEHNDLHDTNLIYPSTTFASVGKFCIRAKTLLVEVLLQHIQPNTLHHLQIDLDDVDTSSTSWRTILKTITDKAAQTLSHLTLEHHFETEETISPVPSDTDQTTVNAPVPVELSMTFDTMQILSALKQLRHFSCDITIPPIITDRDAEKWVTWWPNLEYLVLGSTAQSDSIQLEPLGSPCMTIASLSLFATGLPRLRKLTLPLNISDLTNFSAVFDKQTPTTKASQLEILTIQQLKTSKPLELAHYLQALFPTLQTLEETCLGSQACDDTNDALRGHCFKASLDIHLH